MTNLVSEKENNKEKQMSNKKENQKKSDEKQIPLTEDELEPWKIEVPEFIPIRRELLKIVKDSYLVDLEGQWFRFRSQVGVLLDVRQYVSGSSRFGQITKLLGVEEVEKAIAEAREDYGRKLDPRYWDIFLHGDEEQWEVMRKEADQAHQEYARQHERLKEKEELGA